MRRFFIILLRSSLIATSMMAFGILFGTAVALAVALSAVQPNPEEHELCHPECWLPNPRLSWLGEEYRCKECGAKWYMRMDASRSRFDYLEWTR